MFFSLGGGDVSRPTLFELLAADSLLPGLKNALGYTLGIFEHRRPTLRRTLDRQHEAFALLSLLVERQSLKDNGASFSESLYGLKRCTSDGRELSLSKKRACLLALVIIPYLKDKMEAWHVQVQARRRPAFGLQEIDLRETLLEAGSTSSDVPGQRARQEGIRNWTSLLCDSYPAVHRVLEGLKFLYQFAYLMEVTDFSSPVLHLLGVKLRRVSGMDLLENERKLHGQREQELRSARSHRSVVLQKLHEWTLRLSHLMADNLQYTLVASVFGFKLLEWWFTIAEEKIREQHALPPPPPPLPLEASPAGVGLPEDKTLCPLCRRTRVNPALAEVSGYAFCYVCLFDYVAQKGCCPVTRARMSTEQVRRLYPAS